MDPLIPSEANLKFLGLDMNFQPNKNIVSDLGIAFERNRFGYIYFQLTISK